MWLQPGFGSARRASAERRSGGGSATATSAVARSDRACARTPRSPGLGRRMLDVECWSLGMGSRRLGGHPARRDILAEPNVLHSARHDLGQPVRVAASGSRDRLTRASCSSCLPTIRTRRGRSLSASAIGLKRDCSAPHWPARASFRAPFAAPTYRTSPGDHAARCEEAAVLVATCKPPTSAPALAARYGVL